MERVKERSARCESIQEPLDDEERELMDPENWDWDHPIEVVVAENAGIQMPIDVTFEEFACHSEVARAVGLTPREFMKRAALEAAHAARR
jgi:hypothetical protein